MCSSGLARTIPGDEGPFTRVTEPTPVEFTKAQRDMSPDHYENFSVPFPDFILDSPPKVSMLQTAQNVAEVYGLTRADLDEYAVPSHQKAVEAYEAGRFRDEIVPLEVEQPDRKSTRLNSSHVVNSYALLCLKKKQT